MRSAALPLVLAPVLLAASCGGNGGLSGQPAAASEAGVEAPPAATAGSPIESDAGGPPGEEGASGPAPSPPAPTDRSDGEAAESGDALPLGEPFELEVGASARLEGGLEVVFESVVEDSRCPEDVDCIWEGNAEIALRATEEGAEPASLRLHTNPRFATEASYRRYTLRLTGLEPYPRSDRKREEPYRATLVVESPEGS